MAICIPQLGLAIYTSPKVLSTSLKLLAFELENGRRFESFHVAGRIFNIHGLNPTAEFEPVNKSDYPHVVAFVRDPVQRFKSMFVNRVVRKYPHTRNQWKKAELAGLSPQPSLEEFLGQIDDYVRIVPEIRHHAAPQNIFLGRDAHFFNQIFSDKTVPEFENYVSSLSGARTRLPWEQKSHLSKSLELTDNQVSLIRSRYAEDFHVFGQYFM